MKTLSIVIPLSSLLLVAGCAKRPTPYAPVLKPKAYGTQIVEQNGNKQAAGVGARLSDPLIVQVNGADSNGIPGALVTFRGSGVLFAPAQVLTDDNGQASTIVQLGAIPGSYEIVVETPKSGGGVFTLKQRAIALGYQEKVGREIADKYCEICHNPESTPERVSNYDNLSPPQPHTLSDGTVLNAMTDSDLYKIISEGGPALGKSPQTPAYRTTLVPSEIKAVIAYMRAIADPPSK